MAESKKDRDQYAQGYLDGVKASCWTCGDCGNMYDAQVDHCPNRILDEAMLITGKSGTK